MIGVMVMHMSARAKHWFLITVWLGIKKVVFARDRSNTLYKPNYVMVYVREL